MARPWPPTPTYKKDIYHVFQTQISARRLPVPGSGPDQPAPAVGGPELYGSRRQADAVGYFRAGNSAAEMVYVAPMRDGSPMRFFPIGAKSDVHVALAVVVDSMSGTKLETYIAGPEKRAPGQVVLDIGLVEI